MSFWTHLYTKFFSGRATAAPSGMNHCSVCGRLLGVSLDPMSGDCGGDCWGCIGDIEASTGASSEDNISIDLVAKEISWGWRNADGTPKPQAYFLEGDPSFIQVQWHHQFPDEPMEIWSELNAHREEVRKLEIWSDGRIGYATGTVEIGGSRLGEKPLPPVVDIAASPEFEVKEISRFAFEERWQARCPANSATT